jgi:cysteine desulfurase/selenocysteine lyase
MTTSPSTESGGVFLPVTIRDEFPILSRSVRDGVPLCYLDSAATSQKPMSVLEAMTDYYTTHNANIHRGIHALAVEATELYENARRKIARYIHTAEARQIIFTRNATEGINLVAQSWARHHLKSGDRVLLTEMEHHSNLVPWQILADEKDLRLEFIPLTPKGELDLDICRLRIREGPRIVALTQMSNVLGTINPVAEIVAWTHAEGGRVLIDGAQSAAHMPVDVTAMDVDFFVFSAHKMCGPTGIGALYGKMDALKEMPPFLGGGEMIRKVDWRSYEPNSIPHAFEAGTPAIAEAVGFGVAAEYLETIGLEAIHEHDRALVGLAMDRLESLPGIQIMGPGKEKRGGLVSFVLKDIHPHDIAQILDSRGVAVRAGHHCAMPLHHKLGLPASTRASFYLYNRPEEVDVLMDALEYARKVFA